MSVWIELHVKREPQMVNLSTVATVIRHSDGRARINWNGPTSPIIYDESYENVRGVIFE